ncbi:precorrin-6y C5,15-methyltransferase (decarboxylating) subunit CbiE [Dethiothermospora halolimnae]|uniref:precorrin-6y C5,15-methyltransferase (decarboxylating) subunit CbiE n=1 Tax=Dethiothermospora halolimnae TaxID=3114390 RepID=UPI003CCC092D
MNKIKVIGLGPGHGDYVLPIAKEKIEEAEIIIGAKRNLESVKIEGKDTFEITGRINEIVPFIKNNINKNIAIIVSGDTGFYSLLSFLKRNFSSEDLEVVPGISSIQYMFSKLGQTWQDAYIGSLHGREIDFIAKVREYKKVGLLTDRKWTPTKIAEELINKNINNRLICIGENLSYDNENVTIAKPNEVIKRKDYDISVVVIIDEMEI